jgi:hypothetical protein
MSIDCILIPLAICQIALPIASIMLIPIETTLHPE